MNIRIMCVCNNMNVKQMYFSMSKTDMKPLIEYFAKLPNTLLTHKDINLFFMISV